MLQLITITVCTEGKGKIMKGIFLFQMVLLQHVSSLMVMNETSCVEVEEEECGICHTIYMEECKMKMVEEMMPVKVSMCKNVTNPRLEKPKRLNLSSLSNHNKNHNFQILSQV